MQGVGSRVLQTVTTDSRETDPSYVDFEIRSNEITGPFDLHATIKSGQTAMPEWLWTGSAYTEILQTRYGVVLFSLTQLRGPIKPALRLRVLSAGEFRLGEVQSKIVDALDLKRDLRALYRSFPHDILGDSFAMFPGLRLMRAWDYFEALVSCILTQWSSVKGWNTVARRLRRSLGSPVTFPDGSMWHLPPTPGSLAEASKEVLQRCGTGFRARYLKQAAAMILSEGIDLNALGELPYPEAKGLLMEVPGVGTKVADCLLLYGYGMLEAAPVDVWMHRILQKLYLNGKRLTQRGAEKFLRERFDGWAGYAQLYLYHYARIKGVA